MRSPKLMSQLLGHLFFKYTGYPLNVPSCNVSECQRSQATAFECTYTFPSWMIRYTIQCAVQVSRAGIYTILKARNKLPKNPHWFGSGLEAISYDNLLQNIDVLIPIINMSFDDSCGGSILHKTLWSGSEFTDKEVIDKVKLLLSTGADPDQLDNVAMSCRHYVALVILSRVADLETATQLETLIPFLPSMMNLTSVFSTRLSVASILWTLKIFFHAATPESSTISTRKTCLGTLHFILRQLKATLQQYVPSCTLEQTRELKTWTEIHLFS